MVPNLCILSNVVERLYKLNEPNTGNVYGVVCKDSLIIFTYTLNVSEENTNENIDLQSSLPAEVDLCGILCIGQEEPDITQMFKDVDVTDNPILLKYSQQNIEAFVYIHQKLERISSIEIINEVGIMLDFSYIRVHGDLSLVVERENILDNLDELKKSIASGKIGFHFSHYNTFILGSDGDDSAPNTKSVKDLKSANSESNNYHLHNNPQIMNAVTANTSLKISKSKESEEKRYAPVIRHIKKTCEYYTLVLKLDALSFVHNDIKANRLYEILVESVCRNLRLIRKSLEVQLKEVESPLKLPTLFHFKPLELGHPVTLVYSTENTDDDYLKQREFLHQIFHLEVFKPCFRMGNTVTFESDIKTNEPIINPHEAITKNVDGKVSLVHGLYSYYHYMQGNFDDDGWGCAYRSLQTIVSWFRFKGYTAKPIPKHREIQKCLVDIGDKSSEFIGSKKWIGSTEVSFILESLFGVQSRILVASSGEEMPSLAIELAHHFKTQGTPVMIGGGVLAHTIIGVSLQEDAEKDVKYLILDPHYTGKEDTKTIINKGLCGWKANNFWRKDAFYNMCLPQRPKLSTI